jgi:uncharacterized protein with HEPN domain
MMKPHEEFDAALLYSIREECATILSRIAEKTLPDFVADPNLQDAVVMRLILIGETVKRLSPHTKGEFPEIEWKDIARFRDKAVHHYSHVDFLQVWEIVRENIPALLEALAPERE